MQRFSRRTTMQNSTFLSITIIIIIISISIINNINLMRCLLDFLIKLSSYSFISLFIHLFIFNRCISLQLICPCANFHFILFHFILFFILLAVSLRLFLSCRLTLFQLMFRFCVHLEMLEGLWFSDFSRVCGMGALVIFGSINNGLIWLMVFSVCFLWGRQRACGPQVILEGVWNGNIGQK